MVREIPLTRGLTALIDDEDFERVSQFKWQALPNGLTVYAVAWNRGVKKPTAVRMHRIILDAAPGQIVDHINGNGLDCRRCNMRFVDARQNAANRRRSGRNTLGYVGVAFYRDKRRKPYRAGIMVGGRIISSHYFSSPEEAARAYDDLVREHVGEFGRLNFPEPTEQAVAP